MKRVFISLCLFICLICILGFSFIRYKISKDSITTVSINEDYIDKPLLRKMPDKKPLTVYPQALDPGQGMQSGISKYPNGIFYSNRAVVLTYHHISNNVFSAITIKPQRFEDDLKMLVKNKFSVISIRQLIDAMAGRYKLPDNAVVITFDDGIESFYKYAYPLLKKYNMPAVNFVITARCEVYTPSSRELNPLSAEEILEMYKSGLVDIQSHSHNSHEYVKINPELKEGSKLAFRIYRPETSTYESEEEYRARVLMDLAASRDIILKYVGQYPDMLCFPFGHYNNRLKLLSEEAGFKYFITTEYGYNRENSKSNIIYRIRSGDAALNSEKLFKNIIDCANKVK